nr:MAG TPA: hypothetical protein [Caudoviricetes sp.]
MKTLTELYGAVILPLTIRRALLPRMIILAIL